MGKVYYGQVGRLKRECIEEYKFLHTTDVHTEKWAQVLATIADCNLRNYNIFIEDDVVFAFFEYVGEDYEADMKKMEQCPVTQEWWKHTKPCFTKYKESSTEPFYNDMEQIFLFSGEK